MEAVIWDMDGVIVDTLDQHHRAWAETFAEVGVELTRDEFTAVFGTTNDATVRRVMGSDVSRAEIDRLAHTKEMRFRAAFVADPHTVPGVLSMMERLRLVGIRQAIASSAPMENIDVVLDTLRLDRYIDVVVSGTGLPSKPDPAVFVEAAGRLGAAPHHCVVLEDSIAGLRAGRAAGMKVVGVATTESAAALDDVADVVVNDLTELRMATIWQD